MTQLEDYVQVVVLALVQGLTEFLPISSSAHLILLPKLLGWSDQGLTFDVATHFGTLLAVVTYFRFRLGQLAWGSIQGILKRDYNEELQFVVKLVVATVPIVVAGSLAMDLVESHLRSIVVIGLATIVFAIVLLGADIAGKKEKHEDAITIRHSFLIGLAQVLALVPGTSRSGITITAALLLGFSRTASARFSFLLAIPTIAAAAWLTGMDALGQSANTDWTALGLGVLISFLAAYLCIDAFLRFVDRVGMTPFVVYRAIIGVLLLGSVTLV